MSISFNHPKNTMTSQSSLSLIVTGGNTTTPQPIRFNSTSVVMPVRALPAGEAGAMVFDTASKTMKYHDGTSWVEILGQDVMLQPIYTEINLINQKLSEKVDSVSYSTATIPFASISGTHLSIIFPADANITGAANGLYTSNKQGCIQYFALSSGMNADQIREQMSGTANGQAGRDGTQAKPFITNDGWCFSDGMWWTWVDDQNTVIQQVPNLNRNAYLKPMSLTTLTQTNNVIVASSRTGDTAITINQMPAHSFTLSGRTNVDGRHSHTFSNIYSTRISIDDVRVDVFRSGYGGGGSTNAAGDHSHEFSGQTQVLGANEGHSHDLSNLDVSHFTVAVLYNIALPSFALKESVANTKYVLKAGDVMTGSLSIETNATIRSDDTNVTLAYRNTTGVERAMVYHSSTNNTLRMRSSGGTEVTINPTGVMTIPTAQPTNLNVTTNNALVNGKNIVRSINGITADVAGELALVFGSVQDVRQSGLMDILVSKDTGRTIAPPGACVVGAEMSTGTGTDVEFTLIYTWTQKLIDGVWYTVGRS